MRVPNVILMAGLFGHTGCGTREFRTFTAQDSGLVGLATGQTVRFSVLYPGIPAPVALVQVPITLIIEDDQGNTLASQDFVLIGGIGRKAVSASVNADAIMPRGHEQITNSRLHAYPGQLNRWVSSGHSGVWISRTTPPAGHQHWGGDRFDVRALDCRPAARLERSTTCNTLTK